MRFQKGQLIKCIRVFHPEHRRVLGAVGEIKEVLDPISALLTLADYIVYFPAFGSGKCHMCEKHHDVLYFAMVDFELGPVDDPDAQTGQVESKELNHG